MTRPTTASRIDTRSARYRACLHLSAHAVVADAFGWRVREVVVYDDATGHTHARPPAGLDGEVEVLQRVAFLLAGPAASQRVGWVLPAGCRWDEKSARRVLREAGSTGVTYRQGKTLARVLVDRRWAEIQRHARDLCQSGRWER